MSEVEAQPSGSPRRIKWAVFAALVLAIVIVAMNLPRGFSDDLTRIGKGKAAVVLVRDKNAVESMQLMNVLNGVRDQYHGHVEFLLTDYDTPQGRAFMAANNAAPISLVLFDASGKAVKVLAAPQTAANLEKEIMSITGAKL